MKKRVTPLLLTVFLFVGLLPTASMAAGTVSTAENAPVYLNTEAEYVALVTIAAENTEDFVARIKEIYGVNVIEDIPSTPEGQRYLENALNFIGQEVIESITSIKKLNIYFRAKKNNNTLGSSGSSSDAYYVMLYEGFPSTTPIHELMHVVNFALDRYVSNIDEVIASLNDGRRYGTPWEADDKHYFAYSYGKERASDDIATIPGSIYANRDGIADRIRSNKSPALRKKWEYLRDLCNLYLGNSPMFEILGHQNPTPKKIELSTSNLNLTIGETQKLTATVLPEGTGAKITYQSSNTRVSVDAEGNITANSTGSATITVQAGRLKATCKVDVSKPTPTPTPKPAPKPTPLPAPEPTTDKDPVWKSGVRVLSYPTKSVYLVGEKFDTSGLKVVAYVDDKEKDVSDDILFCTLNLVRLTQGMAFTTTGTMFIQLRQASGEIVGEFLITVINRSTDMDHPASANHPFTDITSGAYYEKPVIWALENGITSGTSATTFSPNDACTSDQVVTFLWRANGKPAADGISFLALIYSDQFYTNAIAWADSIGLLFGAENFFYPDSKSPRANIVTYLYRNAGSPDISTSADTTGNR